MILQVLARTVIAVHALFAAIGFVEVRRDSAFTADLALRVAVFPVVGVCTSACSSLVTFGTNGSAGVDVVVTFRRGSLLKADVTDLVAVARILVRCNSRLMADKAFLVAKLASRRVGVICFRRCANVVTVLAVRLALVGVLVGGVAVLATLADIVARVAGLVTVGGEHVRRILSRLFFADLADLGAVVCVRVLVSVESLLAACLADLVARMVEEVRRNSLVTAHIARIVALGGKTDFGIAVGVVALLFSAVLADRVTACAAVVVVRRGMKVLCSAGGADLVSHVLEFVRNVLRRAGDSMTELALLRAVAVVLVMRLARLVANGAFGIAIVGEGMRLRFPCVVATRALRLAAVGDAVRRILARPLSAELAVGGAVVQIGVRSLSHRTAHVTGGIALWGKTALAVDVVPLFLAADRAFRIATHFAIPVVVGLFLSDARTADLADVVADIFAAVCRIGGSFGTAYVAGRVAALGTARVGVLMRSLALVTANIAFLVAVT